jgi:hypothetical protein
MKNDCDARAGAGFDATLLTETDAKVGRPIKTDTPTIRARTRWVLNRNQVVKISMTDINDLQS